MMMRWKLVIQVSRKTWGRERAGREGFNSLVSGEAIERDEQENGRRGRDSER